MALTDIQKQILGMMTDEGKLTGANRIAVAASDVLAVSQIAGYKAVAIPAKTSQLTIAQALVVKLQADLAILNAS